MTRKDYVLLAAAIVATRSKMHPLAHARQLEGIKRVAAQISNALEADNPPRVIAGRPAGFSSDRFLTACGYSAADMQGAGVRPLLAPLKADEKWGDLPRGYDIGPRRA